MRFLFTDETNLTPDQGDFFIYGGVVVSPSQMEQLHRDVSKVRSEWKFSPEDQLKFHTRSRPQHLSVEEWTKAKAAVVEATEKSGAQMLAYVVLHDIAKNQNQKTLTEWAINSILSQFNFRYLADANESGAVCADRLDEAFFGFFKNKFQEGLRISGSPRSLDRIIHYSQTCDGASHLSSVVDVTLGGLRYCVNASSGSSGSDEVARKIFPPIARTMWSKTVAGVRKVGNHGLIAYPKEISVPDYRAKYEKLAADLSAYSKDEE